ncbi:hypothetical protein [Nocardia gipuzkoensis]|uniref:hypothetical protein n=1 Tax=Nocardia gipuzkoensis TaxID=2749991 RepID=UPI00237E4FCD|nr:hypothetical protein [Nocardia gipuzkoensis]MDE1672646.1 hypothetical protein [Nocardia gipuzkoensis]
MSQRIARRMVTASAVLLVLAMLGCDTQDSGSVAAASAQRWSPGALPPAEAERRGPAAVTALPPELGVVDRGDPDATAQAALRVWFAWNTNTDAGPSDAAARAAPLLARTLVEAISASRAVAGPGAQWSRWANAHASAAVRVDPSPESVPPQTGSEAFRVLVVTQSMFTPRGELLDTVVHTVTVVLRTGRIGWEVSDVAER